ncbi:5-demethoxyubiquinone hydroxylase, mitochondrial [Candida viswanathii]|uniref:5-demethoxyubiquinone hydroxylase, mitochondrial n=1 Tax=Candida viswanathii TaxID=5486 RepID=A0A367YG08_9ASCO|nr:5-demethoxyubiquinone hydroxylase, mitochondrial [Candida viswanathii]
MISRASTVRQIRQFSSTSTIRNKSTTTTTTASNKKQREDITYGPLSEAQKAYLDRVIRVDQAGELGANYIYMGQYFVLANKYPHLKPVLKHMWEQEIHHHDSFNKLQTRRRVRPSLLTPFWKVGAVGMGVGTALIGKEAAMACTVAVETVIGGHYNQQLRVLMNQYGVTLRDRETGEVVDAKDVAKEARTSGELEALKKQIGQFRDDELEHLDTALEHDAEKAVPYIVITEAIKLVCRGAIWAAERV